MSIQQPAAPTDPADRSPDDQDPVDQEKAAPPEVRPAIDADDVRQLKSDPSDEDGKLEIALDETFPTSDPPSNTQPGKGKDPAPSSGYDPEFEKRLADEQGH